MPNGIKGPTIVFPHPTLELAPGITNPGAKLIAIIGAKRKRGITYGPKPGWKPKTRGMDPTEFVGHNFETGEDGPFEDCSGEFADDLDHLTGGAIDADVHTKDPDGSQAQRAWMARMQFKLGKPADAYLKDGVLRAGTITPDESGFGHVFYIWNGYLIESHGSHAGVSGPDDTRTAISQAFVKGAEIRVLWVP